MQYQVSYGKDSKGIFFQPQVYFSGVKGTYMLRIKSNGRYGTLDSNPSETPIPFVLFESDEISLSKVYLFKLQE